MTRTHGGRHVSAVKASNTPEHRFQFSQGRLFVAPPHPRFEPQQRGGVSSNASRVMDQYQSYTQRRTESTSTRLR